MRRKVWYALIIGVALVVVGAGWYSNHLAAKAAHEQAIISELRQLRGAVQMYKLTFKENPKSLAAAMDAKYPFTTPTWSSPRDKEGSPVDPFKRAYQYDPKTGWVRSATDPYQKW